MTPEISVVVGGRNDGYGGDFIGRVVSCIRAVAAAEDLTGVKAEVVLVDWNPPAENPKLKELIPQEIPSAVKVVEVPNEVHDEIDNPGNLPMYEYLAKNVGIRRSSADVVLVTNPDIVISPAILLLARLELLQQDVYLRADRVDFKPPIPRDLVGSAIVEFAAEHSFVTHRRPTPLIGEPSMAPGSNFLGPLGLGQTVPFGAEIEVEGSVFLTDQFFGANQIHLGMPGDFLMANKRVFDKCRGYWERTDTFNGLDYYILAHLLVAGVKAAYVTNPYLIFHEDHSRNEALTRLGDAPIEMINGMGEILAGKIPLPENPNWGFGDRDLPEFVTSR